MPDPSHRPYQPMTTIRPHKMPSLWWLFPWSYAKTLHISANAVKAYADRLDEVLDLQRRIIEEQAADIRMLKQRVSDQTDAMIRGTAYTPDARPHE